MPLLIGQIKRAFEILLHPPELSQVTDYKILKQDVCIAEVAKKILPCLAAALALGLAYSFYVGATLPASLCGAVLFISVVAYIRFSQFERRITRDLDPKNLSLAALDWKNGVPDPVTLEIGSDTKTNLANIKKISKMTPAPIGKVIEKCWTYALAQKEEKVRFYACMRCHKVFPRSEEARPITFECSDGSLRLPDYVRDIVKNHPDVGKIKEESPSKVVMDGISMKKLFRWPLFAYLPHLQPLGSTKTAGFPYFNNPVEEDTDFNETIAFLKTLNIDEGNEEHAVKSNIESTLILSKKELNNKNIIEKLKEAKVTSLTLGTDVTNEDLASLVGFALKEILSKSSHITEKGLKHLDGMPIMELTLTTTTNEILQAVAGSKTLTKLTLL